ncbi:MAG: alpha/beta hydrolase [Promethearchaeota archaeon]|jgi:proline-specific peptidase
MTELFADIKGLKICYEILGEGAPLILVQGFGGKKENWLAQFKPLSEHFQVIRYDGRGAGKSDRPNEEYTIEVLADDIAGLLDYLKIERVHIVGHSMGGMIVQNVVLKYPELVDKMILISTAHDIPSEAGIELYKNMLLNSIKSINEDPDKYFRQFSRNYFHREFRKQMEAEPKKKWYGLWSVDDLIKNLVIDPPTEQDITLQAKAIVSHHVLERLHEIKNETLLIAGSHDQLTSQAVMEELHEKIPNSTLKIIDKAGHGCIVSKAPEINQIIIDFLKK